MNVLELCQCLKLVQCLDFFRVRLDASLGDNEAEELPGRDPKNTLVWVELHVKFVQIIEGLLQVGDEGVSHLGLDDDVIHIGMQVDADLAVRALLNGSMVCSTCIFQPEWHRDIAEGPLCDNEGCCQLVRVPHVNLVLPGVRVQKR